jgi:hypothetical protein
VREAELDRVGRVAQDLGSLLAATFLLGRLHLSFVKWHING